MEHDSPMLCDSSSSKSETSAEKDIIEPSSFDSLHSDLSDPIKGFNKVKRQGSRSSIGEQPGI